MQFKSYNKQQLKKGYRIGFIFNFTKAPFPYFSLRVFKGLIRPKGSLIIIYLFKIRIRIKWELYLRR